MGISYINAEEARNLSRQKRERLDKLVYGEIENAAKLGHTNISISFPYLKSSIEDIEILMKELMFKGFKVRKEQDMFNDMFLYVSW
jgi:hypothetical protein